MRIIIAVPCYNEEAVLERNIKEILNAIKNIPQDIKIVISDNNSKDRTAEIGKKLAEENDRIEYVFVGQPGKGAAVIDAWKKLALDRDRGYDVDIYPHTNKTQPKGDSQDKNDIGVGVYGFMDADLATDLEALPLALSFFTPSSILPLEKGEEGGGYDIVIGSRRIKGAAVRREPFRKFTSAVLNAIIRIFLKTKIKDTACGFKFFKKDVLEKCLPKVQDRKWTFDTEFLIFAERAGFKIKEIPVRWEEKGERGSRVNIYPTIGGYLKTIMDIKKRLGKEGAGS